MRTLFIISACIGLTVIFSSCRNTHAYEKYVKELDSLKVVLQQSVTHFRTVDSSACLKAYSRQYTYSRFIDSHLKDTVNKTTAENLQTFHSVGKGLNDYLSIRSSWLNEADLSIGQLQTLSHDLKTGSIDEEEAVEFINEEKRQAEKIIEELNVNTETIRKHLELYNQTLPVCEDLVKKLNNGILPELIHPEIKHPKSVD